jgi:acetoin:2,6-dichlorophenolindophenol oxidoreductase subunit alpha
MKNTNELPLSTSLALYRRLYLARRSEEFVIEHYPEDQMRTPMHMSMGQEAVSVGLCLGLDGLGDIFTSYRSHAAFLAQTGSPELFFGELYGRVSGTASGKGGSMHLAAPNLGHMCSSGVVASTVPMAVGTAFANVQLKSDRLAVVFFGDGATDAGVFWESLNAAALFRLPMIFVCEDNGFAVNTPSKDRRGYRSLPDLARQYNCDVYEDASNDVESIYRLTREAAALSRERRRPAFMNITCIRYLEHVGISEDWATGYRDREDFDFFFERDCLRVQRLRLLEYGMSEVELAAEERAITMQIEAAIQSSKQAAKPAAESLYRGVYHESH